MGDSQFYNNEAELIKKAKTDENAFNTLYEHYFPKIYNFIIKRTGKKEVAEDIVSSTFMQSFVHLGKYEHRNYTFGAWLYKIASNKLIDHYRKEAKKKTITVEDYVDAENIKNSIDLDFEAEKVRRILKKLSPKYQKVIDLKYFSELSNNEIAQVMGISVNNAYVLIFRALKKFKKYYEQQKI